MKDRRTLFVIGGILIAIGLVIFLKSIHTGTVGFYRLWGSVSTGGILIILILVDVILYVALQNKITLILLPILIGMLIISLILGTTLYFHANLLDLFLMLAPIAVGSGLVLRGLFIKKD